ncbi:MAG: hypothetical protein NTW28_33425, partial [Candidatus Solibacter sp.]|nr:hypothetical protein [Candidatus Solibacter sp.]
MRVALGTAPAKCAVSQVSQGSKGQVRHKSEKKDPGMVRIHDLNGAGEVLVGQIPDPDSAISQDHFDR